MAMCTLPGHQPSSKHGLLASPSLLGTNVSGMYLRKTRGQCFSLDSGRKNTPLCPCAAEPAAGNGPKHSPPRGLWPVSAISFTGAQASPSPWRAGRHEAVDPTFP